MNFNTIMVDPFGAVCWWGFSPAQDLLEYIDTSSHQDDEINFLIVGGADLRHILKTISCMKRHQRKRLKFFIIENNLEVIARQMMFLSIFLEDPTQFGYQEKVQLFLELFGNSLVRLQTLDYLQRKSTELISFVTNPEKMKDLFSLVDVSNLKFKERDQLEAIFKFWRSKESDTFDIRKHWEMRNRQYLGVRYDSRQNVYDWDYSMKLKDKVSIISFREYAHWRESGIAFEIREDSAYEFPNRTLASGLIMKKDGDRVARRGYWGDIINSPYLAFGIESEEKALFSKTNDAHTKTATDVTEYNITAMVHELIHGQVYQGEGNVAKTSTIDRDRSLSSALEETHLYGNKDKKTNLKEKRVEDTKHIGIVDSVPVSINEVQLLFLALNCVPDLCKKSKYKSFFHMAYFSNSMVHHLTEATKSIFCDDAKLILETTKFMLDIKKDISSQFLEKVTAMATKAGFKLLKNCDPERDAFAFFGHAS